MTKKIPQRETSLYKKGLNREREAVISAHFMHKIIQQSDFNLYTHEEFSQKKLSWNFKIITERLIPAILNISEHFIQQRAAVINARAKQHYKDYGLNSVDEVGISELIAEVMMDRQFIKGSKVNYPRIHLANKIKNLIKRQIPIRMVIPALPYKSSSPLKSRGILPDFAEVNFLLALAEIVRTISWVCKEYHPDEAVLLKGFTIVSDGSRFNHFLNEPSLHLLQYQEQLNNWLKILQITDEIEIIDYQKLLSNFLSKQTHSNKIKIRNQVYEYYRQLMVPLLDFYNMEQTIYKAIELDPDPEASNELGRFIPLFQSLLYIINYECLSRYTSLYGLDYSFLYSQLCSHIFKPYTLLKPDDKIKIAKYISHFKSVKDFSNESLMEYLRQSMLEEAWVATMHYIAEIRSDRDLPEDPISSCFPDYIRWTIHAKPGQLAVLTTTAFGDPVQPWQGSGVFKLTKDKKIKLYTLPVLVLEGMGAIPVIINNKTSYLQQPLFYIDPKIDFKDPDDFILLIKNQLTRKRKV